MKRLVAALVLVLTSACAAPSPDTFSSDLRGASRRASGSADKDKGQNNESENDNAPGDGSSSTNPPAVACDSAETARLQAALDRAHAPSTDVVAAVKTSCGVRFFSSGPSGVGVKGLHRIGSVTKTYVGALTLLLERDGLLRLDDRVSDWIAGVPNGQAINIRQLLRHESGLFDIYNHPATAPTAAPRTWTPQQLLALVVEGTPVGPPGGAYSYCNTNYLLLGMIAEVATGKSLASLIRSRILQPLSLNETFSPNAEPITGGLKLARGLDANGKDVTNLMDMTWAFGAANLAGTVPDVVRWAEALGSGSLLGPDLQKKLLTSIPMMGNGGGDYGLGVKVIDRGPCLGKAIGHDGWVDGYLTDAYHLPTVHTTIAVVVDSESEMGVDRFGALANALSQCATAPTK
jgi:D-alanyl-D-alanine carboxypeptidase